MAPGREPALRFLTTFYRPVFTPTVRAGTVLALASIAPWSFTQLRFPILLLVAHRAGIGISRTLR